MLSSQKSYAKDDMQKACYDPTLTQSPLQSLPMELLLRIHSLSIYPDMPTTDRIQTMISLPLVNSTWRDIYADLTSRDVVLPCLSYLFYLLRNMRSTHRPALTSPIYGEIDIGQRARSLTCKVDLCSDNRDPALSTYTAISQLCPDLSLLQSCFPKVKAVSLCMNFRFPCPRNPNWVGRVLYASISVPLNLSSTSEERPVQYCLLVDDPHIASASDSVVRQDIRDIYIALGGPKVSNLRSPEALLATTFPFDGVSELRIHPSPNPDEMAMMSFTTRCWSSTGSRVRILDSLLRVTCGFNPYHTHLCSASPKAFLFSCWMCSCFLWFTEFTIWVTELEKLSSYRRRGSFFYRYIL